MKHLLGEDETVANMDSKAGRRLDASFQLYKITISWGLSFPNPNLLLRVSLVFHLNLRCALSLDRHSKDFFALEVSKEMAKVDVKEMAVVLHHDIGRMPTFV